MGLNGWVVGLGVVPQAGTTHCAKGWFNGMVNMLNTEC